MDVKEFEDMLKQAQIRSDGSINKEFPREEVVKTSSATFHRRKKNRNDRKEKTKKDKKDGNSRGEIAYQAKEMDKGKYQEIKNYEQPIEEVKDGKGWKAFKLTLLLSMLGLATVAGKTAYDAVSTALTEEQGEIIEDITIETANNTQVSLMQNVIDSIKENSDYKFENLSNEEMLDAVCRILPVQNKIHVYTYQSYFFDSKDQILLEKILKDTYGEEYETYSEEKIRDLKKLAYELLGEDKEKQEYIRDPERVRVAMEKQNKNLNTTEVQREIGDL